VRPTAILISDTAGAALLEPGFGWPTPAPPAAVCASLLPRIGRPSPALCAGGAPYGWRALWIARLMGGAPGGWRPAGRVGSGPCRKRAVSEAGRAGCRSGLVAGSPFSGCGL